MSDTRGLNAGGHGGIEQILAQFSVPGKITKTIPWGNGLINDTFRIYTDTGAEYLMQRVNEQVYSDMDGMMNNILKVTDAINQSTFYHQDGREKQKLSVLLTKTGKPWLRDEEGSCWRIYWFMKNAHSIERTETPEQAYKAGLALGQFHELLEKFPVEDLAVVIPDFHNPAKHFEDLMQAAKEDRMKCAEEVKDDLAFFEVCVGEYDYLSKAYARGEIPLRVNHNDAKINNIMFDDATGEPICMVDLDTIMPGLIPYDFGDAIRSCMCTGKDNPKTMEIPEHILNMELYESYYRGFLESCGSILTEKEVENLPFGARMIALENGMRYLTDYLKGNVYFKVKYPKQNLAKARMHIRLAMDLSEAFPG